MSPLSIKFNETRYFPENFELWFSFLVFPFLTVRIGVSLGFGEMSLIEVGVLVYHLINCYATLEIMSQRVSHQMYGRHETLSLKSTMYLSLDLEFIILESVTSSVGEFSTAHSPVVESSVQVLICNTLMNKTLSESLRVY